MSFEDAILYPVDSNVPIAIAEKWLQNSPVAFRDPNDGELWHICGSSIARNYKLAGILKGSRMVVGVLVRLFPEYIRLWAIADDRTFFKARDFVQTVTQGKAWNMD